MYTTAATPFKYNSPSLQLWATHPQSAQSAQLLSTPQQIPLPAAPYSPCAHSSCMQQQSGHRFTCSATNVIKKRSATTVSATTTVSSVASSSTKDTASEQQNAPAVQAVLFDMDGVLISSKDLSRRAGCQVFQNYYNTTVTPDDFAPFSGMGEAQYLGGVASKYGIQADPAVLVQQFLDTYDQLLAQEGPSSILMPGALELVRACRAAGLKVAVASSAARRKAELSLRACGFSLASSSGPEGQHACDFEVVLCGDDLRGRPLKPSPDIFLVAAERLGVPTNSCVVIEDAVAGITAATAAGMRVAAVATTAPAEKLQAAGAQHIYSSLQALSVAQLTALPYHAANGSPSPASSAFESSAMAAVQTATASTQSAAPSASQQAPGQQPASSTSQARQPRQRGWLDTYVQLPAGYRMTRRDILKFVPLAGAIGSFYIAATRMKAMSFGSPQALINAVMPQGPDAASLAAGEGRTAAFVRYIQDLEKRGGGQVVPDFQRGLDWLNSPPLSLSKELKGKVVVLDFWTYCCINCMHVLPDLAAIEARYKDQPFSVVGVHSAKFDNEKDSDAIRNAVLRYDVTHPVVNDGNMSMWGALGVSSWPTLAIVSPRGRLLAMLSGENHKQDLIDFVDAALLYYGQQGLLDNTPVPESLEKDKNAAAANSPLRYPGKIAIDAAGGRLFISDSNNHRIVITTLDGQYLAQIGGNGPALADGSFTTAAFNRPQGLAYSSAQDVLYVADTESHALRCIDLRTRTVSTLAGNGTKGSDYEGGGSGPSQVLNSPWDVALDADQRSVYVAMAGQHQIWRLDISTGTLSNFSGTGYERNQNGPTRFTTAWAQPSGLALAPDGRSLFVADSESSTVRSVDLSTGAGSLRVGGDPLFSDNLFRFGDRDGTGSDALLQHPLGVCVGPDGKVYVADSYNHRIKVLDPTTNTITTLAGTGKPGLRDGPASSAAFSEPAGLTFGPDNLLYIADTNNNAIRVLNPRTGNVSTLALSGVPRASSSSSTSYSQSRSQDGSSSVPPVPAGVKLVRAQQPVTSAQGTVSCTVKLPDGYHLTEGAGSSFKVEVLSAAGATAANHLSIDRTQGQLPNTSSPTVDLKFKWQPSSPQDSCVLRVYDKVYFCVDGGACLFEQVCFEVTFSGAAYVPNSSTDVSLSYSASAAAPALLPVL